MTKNNRCFDTATFTFPIRLATVAVLAGALSTSCVADAVTGKPSSRTVEGSSAIALEAPAVDGPAADRPAVDEPAVNEPAVDEIDPSDAYASEDGRVDTQGNLLPEIIDGLTVGMPYDQARELIIGEIWLPRTYPPVRADDKGVAALQAMGFEEARACSGTGLGLCRLEFVEREGLLFGVVVTTSEAMPTVWSWFVE